MPLSNEDKLALLQQIRNDRIKRAEMMRQKKVEKAEKLKKEAEIAKNDPEPLPTVTENVVKIEEKNESDKITDISQATPLEIQQLEKEIAKKEKAEKKRSDGLVMKLKVYESNDKKQTKKVKKILKTINSSSSESEESEEESDAENIPNKNKNKFKNATPPPPVISEAQKRAEARQAWIKQQAMDFFG